MMIEVKYSKIKYAYGFIVAFACLWISSYYGLSVLGMFPEFVDPPQSYKRAWLIPFVFAWSVYAVLYSAFYLMLREPCIILGDQGLQGYVFRKYGPVFWNEISAVRIEEKFFGTVLIVSFRDELEVIIKSQQLSEKKLEEIREKIQQGIDNSKKPDVA